MANKIILGSGETFSHTCNRKNNTIYNASPEAIFTSNEITLNATTLSTIIKGNSTSNETIFKLTISSTPIKNRILYKLIKLLRDFIKSSLLYKKSLIVLRKRGKQ